MADDGAAPSEAFPDFSGAANDTGGEISMSVEETNKVRAALGLKPLGDRSKEKAAERDAEARRHQEAREAEAKEREVEELRAKIAASREARRQEQQLRSVKTLGEASRDDSDDLAAWVGKSRALEDRRKAADRAKAEALMRKFQEEDEGADDDEEEEERGGAENVYSGKDLAGMSVKHSASALQEGETMVLTLEDQPLLADGRKALNEAEDELENVRVAELEKRQKARRAAKKERKPFEETEEEPSRTILGKYDEEEAEVKLKLDEDGAASAAKRKREEEVARRLKSGLAGVEETLEQSRAVQEEFYTKEEMEAFKKPKKMRKKRKVRQRVEEEDAAAEPMLDASTLEGDALAPADSSKDRGSRADRARNEERTKAARAEEMAGRDAAFSLAKERANAEQAAARAAYEAAAQEEEIFGEDDDELERALARSRQEALQKQKAREGKARGADALADAVVAKREEDGDALGLGAGIGGGKGLNINDTTEFVRGIGLPTLESLNKGPPHASAAAAAAAAAAAPEGDVEMAEAATEGGGGGGAAEDGNNADDVEMGDEVELTEEMMRQELAEAAEEAARTGVEGALGKEQTHASGIAGTLAMLRERDELSKMESWAGRNIDKRSDKLLVAREAEAIASGSFNGRDFTFNLDKYDEYGRKMTPREAFRRLCWKFHGMTPGRMKREKRIAQYAKEQQEKGMSANDTSLNTVSKMQEVQKQQATPYIVLSGNVKPGQTSDPAQALAAEKQSAPPAIPGASAKPLSGKAKVAMWMGGGKSSKQRPPPAPKLG